MLTAIGMIAGAIVLTIMTNVLEGIHEDRANLDESNVEAPDPSRRSTVLLAEDNLVNQRVACRQLEKLGCDVVIANDGLEALENLEDQAFDLILMDCQMPNLDGCDATARIRRLEGRSAHTPIIAMTVNTMDGDREKCIAAGMDGYLGKPFQREQLDEILRKWTRSLECITS